MIGRSFPVHYSRWLIPLFLLCFLPLLTSCGQKQPKVLLEKGEYPEVIKTPPRTSSTRRKPKPASKKVSKPKSSAKMSVSSEANRCRGVERKLSQSFSGRASCQERCEAITTGGLSQEHCKNGCFRLTAEQERLGITAVTQCTSIIPSMILCQSLKNFQEPCSNFPTKSCPHVIPYFKDRCAKGPAVSRPEVYMKSIDEDQFDSLTGPDGGQAVENPPMSEGM